MYNVIHFLNKNDEKQTDFLDLSNCSVEMGIFLFILSSASFFPSRDLSLYCLWGKGKATFLKSFIRSTLFITLISFISMQYCYEKLHTYKLTKELSLDTFLDTKLSGITSDYSPLKVFLLSLSHSSFRDVTTVSLIKSTFLVNNLSKILLKCIKTSCVI